MFEKIILPPSARGDEAMTGLTNLFNKILPKLDTNRYANKIKYKVGDINQDLITYDSDVDCQNLIDNATV